MNRRSLTGLILSISLCITAAPGQPLKLKVWPEGAPGAIASQGYRQDTVFTATGGLRVRNVTDPELAVYTLPPGNAPRAAVVICPGGGYMRLAVDQEGEEVARWLNQLGVVGVVLTYRLPSDVIMKDKSIGPLEDVQEAIRIVRRRSAQWGVGPHKIGVMGFSAGGHLAGSASTLYRRRVYQAGDSTSARPDFSLLIYPVISMQEGLTHPGSRENLLGAHPDSALVNLFSAERQVDADTPPAFLVHSADDRTVPVENSIAYFRALRNRGVVTELHVYERGGHGYGLARHGGTEAGWPEACRRWLLAHGLLP